jgi:hypothetical protein
VHGNFKLTVQGFDKFADSAKRPVSRAAQIARYPTWIAPDRFDDMSLLHTLALSSSPQGVNCVKRQVSSAREAEIG